MSDAQTPDPPSGSPPNNEGRAQNPGDQAPAKRRRRLGCQLVLLGVILTLCVLGLVSSHLWRTVPGYWVQHQAYLSGRDRPAMQQQAEELQQRIISQAGDPAGSRAASPAASQPDVADPDVQTLRATLEELNAWLATNAEHWAANQNLPPQIKDFMLTTEEGDLLLAFHYDTPEVNQVISCLLRAEPLPAPAAEGVAIRLVHVRAGSLPIPPWALPKHIQKNNDSTNTAWMDKVLALADGLPLDPIPVPGGQIRVLAVKVLPDAVEVKVRNEERTRRERRRAAKSADADAGQ